MYSIYRKMTFYIIYTFLFGLTNRVYVLDPNNRVTTRLCCPYESFDGKISKHIC